MAKAHTNERGETLLLMTGPELAALSALLMVEAGDDGPLLDLLEALAPTWTQEVCVICHAPVREDEVTWATPDGRLTTADGEPYCMTCLPSEPQD